MYMNYQNHYLYLKTIVVNNDSSIRALLKHRLCNPKRKLPADILEPEWLVDPSYLTKVVAKPIYLISLLSKDSCSSTKVDVIQCEKCFGYMIKTNRSKSFSEIMRAYKAVVEHLLDNHEFCDEKWCKHLKQKREGKEKELSQSFYRYKKMTKSFTNKFGRYIDHSQHVNDFKNLFTSSIRNKTRQ